METKTLSLLLICVSFAISAFGQTTPAPASGHHEGLRVMSFNIRNSAARDGANDWKSRKELVVSTVHDLDPDLLGVQEVLADQYDDLHEMFPTYTRVGVARDDGIRKGEWSAILFLTARFEQLDSGTFWLSEQPEEVGSISWNAACVRICTWVKLRDRTNDVRLLHANTHFDHKSRLARAESAKLLHERLPRIAAGVPIILTGDFNCSEGDESYHALIHTAAADESTLFDSYREIHPTRSPNEASFHAFKGTTAGSRIDWILHTRNFEAVSAEIIRTSGDRYPSDHYPVTATLRLNK